MNFGFWHSDLRSGVLWKIFSNYFSDHVDNVKNKPFVFITNEILSLHWDIELVRGINNIKSIWNRNLWISDFNIRICFKFLPDERRPVMCRGHSFTNILKKTLDFPKEIRHLTFISDFCGEVAQKNPAICFRTSSGRCAEIWEPLN